MRWYVLSLALAVVKTQSFVFSLYVLMQYAECVEHTFDGARQAVPLYFYCLCSVRLHML